MWESSKWKNEDDVLQDLILLAEYITPTPDVICDMPNSIKQYRQLLKKNKERPLNSHINDNTLYVVSGRGRGIRDRILTPGGIVDSHPLDEVQLKKQIREVAQLGYSNELIEQSIKAQSYDPETIVLDSTLKMVSTSSTDSNEGSSQRSSLVGSLSSSNSSD